MELQIFSLAFGSKRIIN